MRSDVILHSTENGPEPTDSSGNPPMLLPSQANSDEHLIELWLHGRSVHTQRAYQADALRFMDAVKKPLHQVTLGDLQRFATEINEAGLQPASIHRTLSSVKSLFCLRASARLFEIRCGSTAAATGSA